MTILGRWAFLLPQISVVFLMFASFALGGYAVYASNLGAASFDKRGLSIPVFVVGLGQSFSLEAALGDVFAVLWAVYLVLIVKASFGPRISFYRASKSTVGDEVKVFLRNTLLVLASTFSSLVVVIYLVELLQSSVGIPTGGLVERDPIETFTYISIAPLTEEMGFRVSVIGLVAALILAEKRGVRGFLRVLWHPSAGMNLSGSSRIARWRRSSLTLLILASSLSFGLAHITFGANSNPVGWQVGKVTSATISGVALGYMYVFHGAPGAILLHWAFNYFASSYHYFDCSMTSGMVVSCDNIAQTPASSVLEASIFVAGAAAILAGGIIIFRDYLRGPRQAGIASKFGSWVYRLRVVTSHE